MLKQFNSNARKLNRAIPTKVNPENLVNLDLTGSLANIEIPTNTKFNSTTKSNPYPTKIVNNKNTISVFHQEILEHSAMYIKVKVDEFDNQTNTLTIYNLNTDYGTEGASPNNFEVLVFGLHIPGNYKVEDIGNNVVVTLFDEYIDYDNVTIDDIYVIGKLRYLNLHTENTLDIITENGEEIIV